MAGATIAAISEILKNRYLGPVSRQLNDEVLVTQILGLNDKNIDLDGLQAVVPLHYARNSGIGFRREDETLPSAGSQKYKTATFDLAYGYGSVRFTGQAKQKTKSDAGAFIRVVTEELDRVRNDLALDLGRQFYGDGTGAIAKIASVAGAVLTLTSDEALQKGFIDLNMVVDIGTTSTTSAGKASAVTVTDVDVSAKTVTLSSAGTAAANDFVFRSGANDGTGTKEITAGLQALIPTAANTIGGLNAASAGLKWWDNLRDTSGGAISLANLMLNWNKVMARGAKAGNLVSLTSPGLVRRLFATSDFSSNVRFVDSTDLVGGFESISFIAGGGKVKMVSDRLAPYGSVFFVDKEAIQVYSPGDWDFLAGDGLTIHWDFNKDAYVSNLFRYINLGTRRRNSSLVMSGLTDTGF